MCKCRPPGAGPRIEVVCAGLALPRRFYTFPSYFGSSTV